jgi:hypothetical protein
MPRMTAVRTRPRAARGTTTISVCEAEKLAPRMHFLPFALGGLSGHLPHRYTF